MPTRFMRDVSTDKSRLWKCGAYRIVQVTHPTQYSVYTCIYVTDVIRGSDAPAQIETPTVSSFRCCSRLEETQALPCRTWQTVSFPCKQQAEDCVKRCHARSIQYSCLSLNMLAWSPVAQCHRVSGLPTGNVLEQRIVGLLLLLEAVCDKGHTTTAIAAGCHPPAAAADWDAAAGSYPPALSAWRTWADWEDAVDAKQLRFTSVLKFKLVTANMYVDGGSESQGMWQCTSALAARRLGFVTCVNHLFVSNASVTWTSPWVQCLRKPGYLLCL